MRDCGFAVDIGMACAGTLSKNHTVPVWLGHAREDEARVA